MHSYLIYASKCDKSLSEFELIRILYEASGGNARIGISGILIHKVGQFIQLLEGDSFSINDIYTRIKRDKRHFSVELLDQSTTSHTISHDFMAYRNINSSYDEQYKPFFRGNFDFNTLKNHPITAYKFFENIYSPTQTSEQELKYMKYKTKALEKSGLLGAMRDKLSK